MKILIINSVCGIGSTGRICTDLAEILEEKGHTVRIAYGRGTVLPQHEKYAVRIGSTLSVNFHGLKSRIFDSAGFSGTLATQKLVRWIKQYDPDVIHLHNLHGYYLDIRVLMGYLKTCGKKIIWTLHDCWAFTGHCAYFSAAGCEKWKDHCEHCPQKGSYPKSYLFSRAEKNFAVKRELFTGIPNLTIVTPSRWLKERVEESFLKEYPVVAIPNGVDLSVFQPTKSDLRKQYHLEGQRVVLGVASSWDARKGLLDFYALSKMLPSGYRIVLVGLEPRQIAALPETILGIPRTNGVRELAQWYTACDVFVNTSVEETMGLTTVEALACGTPVIVYNKTAIPEVVDDTCSMVVEADPRQICQALDRVAFSPEACMQRAALYEKKRRFLEYVDLYTD